MMLNTTFSENKTAFNSDEIGLFWKRMPNRSYIIMEKGLPRYKPMKDRLTLLVAANYNSLFKVKPLLFYNSDNYRAFK